jgi:tryptophanyl-tRNA synthetase
MKTVFSGIQPSGELHLGNYLGAIRNWVSLQDQYRCIFCVVDYHAITQDYVPKEMSKRVSDMVVDLIALGIDPERSLVFLQSMVPEHTELCWVFNNVTGFGDLERMTQFKDKSEHQPKTSTSVFDYPVLQAARFAVQGRAIWSDKISCSTSSFAHRGQLQSSLGQGVPECGPLVTNMPKVRPRRRLKMSKSAGNALPLNAFGREVAGVSPGHRHRSARVTRQDPAADICNILLPGVLVGPTKRGCAKATAAGIGCRLQKKLSANMMAYFKPYAGVARATARESQRVADVRGRSADKARSIAARTMVEVHSKLGSARPA